MNGMGQGLLTVNMLAQVHGGGGGNGMDMIGRAYGYGIDVLLLVQHFPKVGIDLGFGKSLDAFRAPYRIDVTKSHDIRTRIRGAGHVGRTLAPYPDSGDVDALIGAPYAGGQELKGEGRGGSPDELSAGKVFHYKCW